MPRRYCCIEQTVKAFIDSTRFMVALSCYLRSCEF